MKNYSIRMRLSGPGKKGPGKTMWVVSDKLECDKALAFLNAQKDGNTYFATEGDDITTADGIVVAYNANKEYQAKLDAFAKGNSGFTTPIANLVQVGITQPADEPAPVETPIESFTMPDEV